MMKWPLRTALIATTALCAPASWAQDVIALDDITVSGSSYQTEGSDSYRSDLISVGEKSAMTPREVPQSSTVVTRRQIEDGGYSALETALQDTAGIMVLNNDIGRSSLFSRGFEFDYLYYDGLPAPVSSIYGTQPDLSIVDHVEVLKGPSGLFIGTGSPAGSINMRLKQADRKDPGGYLTVGADSTGRGRVEADLGGKLNEDGTLRGRAVVAYADGDGFVDKQSNGVRQLYGALAWDISPATTMTVSYSHMERDIAPYNGLPTYADGALLWIDSGATTAADWNSFENSTDDLVLALEHKLDNGARLKLSARKSWQDADMLYAYGASAAASDNTISSLAWLARDFSQESLALDAHAELPFTLGNWEGMAIVGADWQEVDATTLSASGKFSGSWDLDDWDVSGVAAPNVTYTGKSRSKTQSSGLYAQMRIKPRSDISLIGGARLSWTQTDTTNLVSGATSRTEENAHLTPFAGITWDMNAATTLYASYSEIFQPQTNLDVNGDTLDPVEGQQIELGVKAEIGQGLNLSAALFQLEQVNRPLSVTGTTYYVAEEKVRVRGVELEASGEIIPDLHVAAGYTFTDTEYVNGTRAGEDFSTYTPEHLFKVTLEKDITSGALAGWSFGTRLVAMTGFSSRGIAAPGYGVVDLSAARHFDNGTVLRMAVNNVFDKDYYARVGANTVFNFRGAPRNVTLSLTKRF